MKISFWIGTTLTAVVLLMVLVGTVPKEASTNSRTLVRNTYGTPSGHACTDKDWDRQFLQGRKAGEEECRITGSTNETIARQDDTEGLKANCIILSRTPMSAMTPSDLRQWDFCKSVMVRY